MKNVSIIFSADYDFQIIQFVNGDRVKAWDIANKMFEDGALKQCGIEHYDVLEFDSILEMNIWIMEQISESRAKKNKQQITKIA